MDNQTKLYSLISNILEIDQSYISDETSPENTENWDSFNALVLVTELEENFQVTLSMEEMQAIKNVKDIKEILKSRSILFD